MNWNNILDYVDGQLYWKDGKPAGTPHSVGYIQLTFEGNLHLAHRIVWEMHKGAIPSGNIIDHDDRDRKNNRIGNLRLTTYTGNQRNRKRGSNNTSGVTGVSWDKAKNKWFAHIGIDGKSKGLGRYKAISDAVSARKAAEEDYNFHPNHGV